MKRFLGMMPSDEVKMIRKFKVGISKLVVRIQSGEKGWTILYADGSSCYEDVEDSVENNFESALRILNSQFSYVNEVL